VIPRNPKTHMKMSRRALALAVATTISFAGMAVPAHAKGGPSGGGDSSSSSVAPPPAPAGPAASNPTEPAASTAPSSVRGRTGTTAKAPEAHESEPEHTSVPESSVPRSSAPAGTAGTTATTVRRSDDKAKSARDSIEVIDNLIRRLKASSVDPAVRDGLVARLLDMKASFAAGQLANPAALQALAGEVRGALGITAAEQGTTEQGGSTSSTTPEKDDEGDAKKQKGKAVHARAAEALQAEIAKVTASNLPDDVKAKVVAALTEAQQNVASHVDVVDAAKEVHDTLEKQRADKFAAMQQRLAGAADRVQAAIDKAAATPGNEAIVADANAKLVDARAKVAAATTTADLKAAWQLMRDIRKSLPHVELPEPTTTVATTPSTTVAATPDTTAAPIVDTTVAPAVDTTVAPAG
jgi:hypothetical protein